MKSFKLLLHNLVWCMETVCDRESAMNAVVFGEYENVQSGRKSPRW